MSLPLVFHPDYVTPLPPGHRFPMPKFGKVYEYLIKDGLAALEQFHVPQVALVEWLTLAHTPAYVQAYTNGDLDARAMRRIGLPWSPELVNRTRTAVGGTVLTAQLALQHGMACNTAGGTHHAHADFGSGFCIFNDLAVTALYMLAQGVVQRVVDGDGGGEGGLAAPLPGHVTQPADEGDEPSVDQDGLDAQVHDERPPAAPVVHRLALEGQPGGERRP